MKTTIQQVAEALKNTGGFISQAARQLNISQSAVSQRIIKSRKLQQIKKEIEESYLDLAESKLITKIKNNENGAIFFYLKRKGKDRGYVEAKEVAVTSEIKTEVNVNLEQLSTNQIKTILDMFECKS